MIRKYRNYKLQTNLCPLEEEPHNNHNTPGRQTKQINQLFLPRQVDCKTSMDVRSNAQQTKDQLLQNLTMPESNNPNNESTTIELPP